MTRYCCNFSIRPPSAALDGDVGRGNMRSVDLRVGFVEVASERSVMLRIKPQLSRRPGYSLAPVIHRVRIRRHPARDEAGVPRDPKHRRLSSAVLRGSRTRGHRRPPIGRSWACRRSRSCASPSSRCFCAIHHHWINWLNSSATISMFQCPRLANYPEWYDDNSEL